MEVLDAERPPGAVGRWVGGLLERPAVRAAGTAALALGLLAAWFLASGDPDPPVEAQDSGPFVSPLSQATPDPASPPDIDPWRIVDGLTVTFLPDGRMISFSAFNAGSRPRDPRELFMHVGYVSGGASAYIFSCARADRASGPEGSRGEPVPPGGEVELRCEDTIQLNGKPSRLPPEVLSVVTEPPSAPHG